MTKNRTRWMAVAVIVLCAALPQVASADITTFNTNAPGGQGVFNGTGGKDGGFTVTGNAGFAIGLRGAQRTVGPIIPVGDDYTCVAGEQCNFDFSVATTNPLYAPLSAFTYLLTVQDLTTHKSFSMDPTLLDNSYWGSSGKTSTKDLAHQTIFQNSEYLGFNFLGLNWTPTDKVAVYLSASNSFTSHTAEIGFNTAVPEPSAVLLTVIFLGLSGLLVAVYCRRHPEV